MHPDYTLLDFHMNGSSLYNQHDDDYYWVEFFFKLSIFSKSVITYMSTKKKTSTKMTIKLATKMQTAQL